MNVTHIFEHFRFYDVPVSALYFFDHLKALAHTFLTEKLIGALDLNPRRGHYQ